MDWGKSGVENKVIVCQLRAIWVIRLMCQSAQQAVERTISIIGGVWKKITRSPPIHRR